MSVVAFIVEWFDQNAAMVRSYRVNFYDDGTLDMVRRHLHIHIHTHAVCQHSLHTPLAALACPSRSTETRN